jgi:CubicO group peptidase (beta-lactamase class C family)
MALEAIDRWVAEGRADGVAAAVVSRDDGVLERRFAGAAGERSLFALASLTKPVVALAALVAVEEGVLEMDAPACDLLPALADGERRSITLRHLLSHAAGLPESARGTPPAEVPLAYPPGTRRAYSNEGYHLVGLLIEAATEMRFQQYITDAVLAPLGLDAFLPVPESEERRALEVRDPGLSSPGVPLFNAPQWRRRGNAAGGMFASLDAYARVVALLLGGGGPLLHSDTWRELATVQFPGIPGGLESFPKLHCPDWGAGVNVRGTGGPHWAGDAVSPSTLSHFGASGTLMWADLDRGVGLVCLANRGTYSGWMLADGGWIELSGEVIAAHGAPG